VKSKLTDFDLPLPVLIPQVPKPSEWLGLLDESYKSNTFTNSGPLAVAAEKILNEYLGSNVESMVCSSNTSGLIASLLALDLQGKKVIVSNNTFVATLNAIISAGCIPIIADVNPLTWEIDISNITAIIENNEVAGLVFTRVHGFRRDLTSLLKFCAESSISVLIDAAAAFPATPNEYKTPINYLEVFSFHATKPLGIGEGGAVIGSKVLISDVKRASNFGLTKPSSTFGDGINAKLDEFASARLIAGIANFPKLAERRVHFVEELKLILERSTSIEIPTNTGNTSWPFLPIRLASEKDLINFKDELGAVLQTRRYYYPSLARGYVGRSSTFKTSDLSVSEEITTTTLCLPVIPTISPRQKEIYFSHLTKSLKILEPQEVIE